MPICVRVLHQPNHWSTRRKLSGMHFATPEENLTRPHPKMVKIGLKIEQKWCTYPPYAYLIISITTSMKSYLE